MFAQVSRGHFSVILAQEAQGGPGMWVYLDLASPEDLAALHQEYLALLCALGWPQLGPTPSRTAGKLRSRLPRLRHRPAAQTIAPLVVSPPLPPRLEDRHHSLVGPVFVQVVQQIAQAVLAERNTPLFGAFALDREEVVLAVEVREAQTAQFGDANAGVIKDPQDGPVAYCGAFSDG